ncbi:sugar phosphorylase [Clostridium sp. MCC353]|uniref:sugar phosphorylase n=1 Tax=Clostridium sp. MCC353 TaxID=2592646 RepID=UPI001C02920A|nr:sugar phosphorylase [Clostridium sp. MCC353]MBT9775670.1 sugar phosphorylase [Clostridium sp. MCC353]
MDRSKRIYENLEFVYGKQAAEKLFPQLMDMAEKYRNKIGERKSKAGYGPVLAGDLDEKDVILITYGDNFKKDASHSALENLKRFSDKYLKEKITIIHLLPFFPYSSDDGFSVIDYCEVNEDMGTWQDIDAMAENFRLMFDYVANHISAKSMWFEEFLAGNPQYQNYFVISEESPELKKVTRPRTNPLLTEFQRENGGPVKVWTTFSPDQVDINYSSPEVFLKMSQILMEYYLHGASLIRLDAILYMWKELGTECVHLPQTHALIRTWRALTEYVMPEGVILAEVSAPHEKNMSYLGDGNNECHMIYQFPLAPLVLYSMLKQNTEKLRNWAQTVETPGENVTFFNLLACHDGIGVMPARGILPEEEILWLAKEVKKRGGDVSYKSNEDGTESPYELNIVYRDAVRDLSADEDTNTKRFLCAYAVIMAMKGVPGLYIHALLGSHNSPEEVLNTGIKRSINRKKFDLEEIERDLNDFSSYRRPVMQGFDTMIRLRREIKAFDPYGEMKVLDKGDCVFAVLRIDRKKEQAAVAVCNMTQNSQKLKFSVEELEQSIGRSIKQFGFYEAFSGFEIELKQGLFEVVLKPYEYQWILERNGEKI